MAFPEIKGYFWVPIIAPMVGATIGEGLYHSLIGKYLPSKVTASLIVSTQEEIAASTETHSS